MAYGPFFLPCIVCLAHCSNARYNLLQTEVNMPKHYGSKGMGKPKPKTKPPAKPKSKNIIKKKPKR